MTKAVLTLGRSAATVAAVAGVAVAAIGCGRASENTATGRSAAPTAGTELTATTPAASSDVDRVTWALYRETSTLDPAFAYDYPDNTVVSVLCDSLFRQQPDGAIAPGLAATAEYSDPRTLVLGIRRGVSFWDGSPLTADDVVFSLEHQRDPRVGGLYSPVFSRVAAIEKSGPMQVTIRLSKPDFLLRGELSSAPGAIVSKRVAEAEGPRYGTPGGSAMCTGPFKVKSWKGGDALSVVPNDGYWDPQLRPRVGQIDFKGVPDEATLTSGLLTGEIGGFYPQAMSTIDQLRSSGRVAVHRGPSYASDALVVASLRGPLGDVKVRQALSLAIDRQGIVDANYKGLAQLPRTLANPGTWGYARATFQAAWDARPAPRVDVAAARRLVQEAGAEGKTIVLGMTSEVKNIATEANALRSAAESIGMKVQMRAVSAANYISFFVDPKAREGVDGFFTINYPDFADPAALYNTMATPGATANYSGFDDPELTRIIEQARATEDLDERARLVVQADAIIDEQLPWIPVAAPDNVLLMSNELTGAPASFVYMNAPWAATLGGRG